jgi:hypothetical protein
LRGRNDWSPIANGTDRRQPLSHPEVLYLADAHASLTLNAANDRPGESAGARAKWEHLGATCIRPAIHTADTEVGPPEDAYRFAVELF